MEMQYKNTGQDQIENKYIYYTVFNNQINIKDYLNVQILILYLCIILTKIVCHRQLQEKHVVLKKQVKT